MLLRSLVTVAGAMAAAQLAYAAVATGSVHFTSTATMALQNAQQVQVIMLTHHDVEQRGDGKRRTERREDGRTGGREDGKDHGKKDGQTGRRVDRRSQR